MTKKMLVDYDPISGARPGKAFVLPVLAKGSLLFVNVVNRSEAKHGMIVLVGQDISPEALEQKAVSCGLDAPTSQVFECYLQQIKSRKVGSKVSLSFDEGGLPRFNKLQ